MTTTGHPATGTDRTTEGAADRGRKGRAKGYPRWPVILLAGSAFVAIWGGWVELGRMSGFGPVNLLPGITELYVDLSITLPLGMEVYAAYALGAWLTRREIPDDARSFARWSALVSLVVGAGGQIAYHLLAAAGVERAPWPVLVIVSCIPVAVLGMASALAHRLRTGVRRDAAPTPAESSPVPAAAAHNSADQPTGADPEPAHGEAIPAPAGTSATETPAPVDRPVEVPPLQLPAAALAEQTPTPTEAPTTSPADRPADRPALAPVLVERRVRPAGPVTDDERELILSLAANPDVSEREIARRTGRSRDTIKRTIDNHRPAASRQGRPTGRPAARPTTGFTVPAT
ncbi:hypothetical protein JN535_19025 [Cellulosimicrobium cellulans]|uniref:hypothetical protein n=1 Tax=Cellulosimicrobium cellulans TaxID=1710 RepID=UPI0019668DE9|nr:hypothetical protein [Cellulosimicrobium cellulans]MBN0042249.1 hypothetical protein [Cellulosimicrobium cellulans]